jgi:hypothetical protein
MSRVDAYEVEEIGLEGRWMRCRRCGRSWEGFSDTFQGSWRCPGEPHDGSTQPNHAARKTHRPEPRTVVPVTPAIRRSQCYPAR